MGTVAEMIQTARRQHGWSVRELARRIQISPAMLTRVLKGQRRLANPRALCRLCRVLQLDPDEVALCQGQLPWSFRDLTRDELRSLRTALGWLRQQTR